MTIYADPGSVIHGTHRPQDLIPAFMDLLRELDLPRYMEATAQPLGTVPAYVFDEGDSSEWWQSVDAHDLLEGLFDVLQDYAPEGHYFGAHIEDGSDFGFWQERAA